MNICKEAKNVLDDSARKGWGTARRERARWENTACARNQSDSKGLKNNSRSRIEKKKGPTTDWVGELNSP